VQPCLIRVENDFRKPCANMFDTCGEWFPQTLCKHVWYVWRMISANLVQPCLIRCCISILSV